MSRYLCTGTANVSRLMPSVQRHGGNEFMYTVSSPATGDTTGTVPTLMIHLATRSKPSRGTKETQSASKQ